MASKKSSPHPPEGSGSGFFARFTVLAVVVLWCALAAGNWAGRYLVEHNPKFRVSNDEVRTLDDASSRLQARPPVTQGDKASQPGALATPTTVPEGDEAKPEQSPAEGVAPTPADAATGDPVLDPTGEPAPTAPADTEDPDARPAPLEPSSSPVRDETRTQESSGSPREATPSRETNPGAHSLETSKPRASAEPSTSRRAGTERAGSARVLPDTAPREPVSTPARRENKVVPERPQKRDQPSLPAPTPEHSTSQQGPARPSLPPAPTPAAPAEGDR